MKKTLAMVLMMAAVAAAGEREISITVYNSDLALVRDVRGIDFQKGAFTYDFTSIPSMIIPTSVHFKAGDVEIIEQNYEYDMASVGKIQEKFVGEAVRVFSEGGEMFEGRLQPSETGVYILVNDEGKVLIVRADKVVHAEFPRMPENFVERPTLIWTLNSAAKGKREAEVSYLTRGMEWHAEYVAVTGKDKLGFTGWVSIQNNSGETFENAKLKLMAGEVHRAETKKMRGPEVADFMASGAGKAQFEEKAFFEYHLYTLQRPATLKNNQIKQISLFPEAEVVYRKDYIFDTRRGWDKVQVYFAFNNSADAGLGIPLPGGKLRVYQRDEDGSMEFVGEDLIEHTPKDEKVEVLVGTAFDLKAEKKVVDTRRISQFVREEDIEISLRNHKTEAVVITIREHFYGDWKIIKSTHDYTKKDAFTVEFRVSAPPHKTGEESLVKYTVRFEYR